LPSQNSPLLQTALFGALTQASVASLHESAVQAIESLQLTGVPATHPAVPLHVSVPLQY